MNIVTHKECANETMYRMQGMFRCKLIIFFFKTENIV